ncbi:MAG: TMEM175 family protein [Acidimicrobiales bacterium]
MTRVTGSLMWSNLNLLFWLSLFPFTTTWMSKSHFAADPVATYVVVLVCAALAYFTVPWVIVANQRPDTVLRDALGSDWKGRVSIVTYAIAIPLALWLRWGSLTLFGVVAGLWHPRPTPRGLPRPTLRRGVTATESREGHRLHCNGWSPRCPNSSGAPYSPWRSPRHWPRPRPSDR